MKFLAFSVVALAIGTFAAGCAPSSGGGAVGTSEGQPSAYASQADAVAVTPSATDSTELSEARGQVVFSLETSDGYKGVVTLRGFNPVALERLTNAAELSECSPRSDANSTAVLRVDFTFNDESPADFPWELGWGVSTISAGEGRILGYASQGRFVCAEPRSWSGEGTMSVLVAADQYYSPKRPQGAPAMLTNAGAAFPLAGIKDPNIKIRVKSTSGDVRGGVNTLFVTPILELAFSAKR